MQFKGVLRVTVADEKNRSGQRPIFVEFDGEDGIGFQAIGARIMGASILDAMAVVKGTSYKHTSFSPALQAAIIACGKDSDEAGQEEPEDYQRYMNEKMEKKRKAAMGE